MRFDSVVQQNGKTATGIPVPTEVVDALDAGKRPKVTVTIGAYTYRTSVASWGDGFMLSLSAANRSAAGVEAGDAVSVEIELDAAPRAVDMPPDFAAALAEQPVARQFFESLSFSSQRWFTDSVDSAKKAETRAARIDKYVAMLNEGRSR